MTVLFRKLINQRSASSLKRCMHLTSIHQSYEGEGKTTVTILNNNYDYGLMIDNISQYGFILNNGLRVMGPMIIFPKTTLSWNIAKSPDMNEASFSLLLNLDPKLDILVIGLDDEYPYNAPFVLNIKNLFKKYNILTEIQPVYRACSMFNFLNSENRYAAAALIPPRILTKGDMLLKGPNKDQKKIEKDDTRPQLAGALRDPLVPELTDQEFDSQILKRQKEIADSLKVRSPWKPEDQQDGLNKKNKK